MYRAIVKQITRRTFKQVEEGNLDAVLKGCVPDFYHSYEGDHALGGARHTAEGFRLWMERVHRLTPNFRFEIHDILVSGGPQHTTVLVLWTKHTTDSNGDEYPSWGVHKITLKWFRGTSIEVFPDTAGTMAELKMMAANGVLEAAAPPIVC